jgi:hypothetical protein
MAEDSDHNSTMEEFERMMKSPNTRRFFELSPLEVPGIFLSKKQRTHRNTFISLIGSANETAVSIETTPDPLNTAFVEVNMIYLVRNNYSYYLFLQNRRVLSMNSAVKEIYLNNNNKVSLR